MLFLLAASVVLLRVEDMEVIMIGVFAALLGLLVLLNCCSLSSVINEVLSSLCRASITTAPAGFVAGGFGGGTPIGLWVGDVEVEDEVAGGCDDGTGWCGNEVL